METAQLEQLGRLGLAGWVGHGARQWRARMQFIVGRAESRVHDEGGTKNRVQRTGGHAEK